SVDERLQHRRIAEKLRVAAHARCQWRNARKRGCLDRNVAVATVDAIVADMMLVTERHGLLDRGKRGCIRAGIDAVDDRRRNERGEDAEPEQLEAENRRRREDL